MRLNGRSCREFDELTISSHLFFLFLFCNRLSKRFVLALVRRAFRDIDTRVTQV